MEYENDEIKRIDTIVVSTQHDASATQEEIRELIMNEVIKPSINEKFLDENTKYFINPSGSFVVGGSLEIPERQAVRSFVIPMVEEDGLEEAVSLVRIRQRLIAVPLIIAAMWPRV